MSEWGRRGFAFCFAPSYGRSGGVRFCRFMLMASGAEGERGEGWGEKARRRKGEGWENKIGKREKRVGVGVRAVGG